MSNQTDLNRFIACRFNVLCHSFAFEVYDVNRDGYISNGDLFSVSLLAALASDYMSAVFPLDGCMPCRYLQKVINRL